VLGLPDGIRACLFDLDGVLTQTAKVHAAAWKSMFDEFLERRAQRTGDPFAPFDDVRDYDAYVDGRPRYAGVQEFLRSRGIELPGGAPDDPPSAETVDGLGNRKNEIVLQLIDERGVETYSGSMRYVDVARDAGLRRAVVSSSANAREVLRTAGIEQLFEQVIDGVVADREHLRGKPAPDTFLAAAHAMDVEPPAAAVFEDSLAGVEAGRAGGFGFVVGVDRTGQADELRAHGATIVVEDLAELLDEVLDVRTRRAYDPAEPGDGYRILIDRLWPRGVSRDRARLDEWARDLAPSDGLRRWFNHDPQRFREFGERYREELRAHTDRLDDIRERARQGPLTLVYGAKDTEHNDAVVLAEVLRHP
jgi:beta-phosphoglucomutase family hydrolase